MTSTSYTDNKAQLKKIIWIAICLSIVALPNIIFFFDAQLEHKQSFCPIKMLSGFPCPGCGITKSIAFFCAGDLEKSFHYHVLGPIAVIFSTIGIVVLIAELIFKREYFKTIVFNYRLAVFLGITLGIYHIIRLINFIQDNTFDEILKQSIWK